MSIYFESLQQLKSVVKSIKEVPMLHQISVEKEGFNFLKHLQVITCHILNSYFQVYCVLVIENIWREDFDYMFYLFIFLPKKKNQ